MADQAEQQAVPVAQEDREAAADLFCIVFPTDKSIGTAMRRPIGDGGPWVQAFARHRLASVSSASAEGWVPERFTLSERELDDECGCPEETWDTPFGMLNMHLTAGKPSNACLDNGDEGEWSIDLTRATVDDARTAFFAWSMIAASLPIASPEPVPATNQAGEVERRTDELVRRCAAWQNAVVSPGFDNRLAEAANEARAILALATQPATSQEGDWVLVPREITQAMLDATCADDADDRAMRAAWPELLRTAASPTLSTATRQDTRGKWHVMLLGLINAIHRDGGVKTQTIGINESYSQALALAATPTPPTLSEDLRDIPDEVFRKIADAKDVGTCRARVADLLAALARAQVKAS